MGIPFRKRFNIVLVAEDEPVTAMLAEDALGDAGFLVIGPFAACTPALTWLDEHTPDAALLDVKLADDLCLEVARTLFSRGVPMVFFSGGEFLAIRAEFQNAPWFEKPVDDEVLIEALRKLVSGAGTTRHDLTGGSGKLSLQEQDSHAFVLSGPDRRRGRR